MSEVAAALTPDTELLTLIAMGNVTAFGEFYDRHSTLLFSIASKVLSDVHEAEECLQDAVRVVWENAPIYNASLGKPVSWAVVITRNKAIDRLRVLQRKSAAIATLTAQAEADFAISLHASSADVQTRETGALLHGALGELPLDQRQAIELAFFTGLSQTEVATRLGQPLGTIKARIRRGMLTLRDALEEQL
jgi:RNA polymerase sigma-70 factor, ECF subfamily